MSKEWLMHVTAVLTTNEIRYFHFGEDKNARLACHILQRAGVSLYNEKDYVA